MAQLSKNMWKAYLSPTPPNVARILLIVKAILASAAGAEYISGNPRFSFWLLIATGAITELASFISNKPPDNQIPKAE